MMMSIGDVNESDVTPSGPGNRAPKSRAPKSRPRLPWVAFLGNPFLRNELRRHLRWRRGIAWSVIGVGAAAVFLWYYIHLLRLIAADNPSDGQECWEMAVGCLLVLIAFRAPASSIVTVPVPQAQSSESLVVPNNGIHPLFVGTITARAVEMGLLYLIIMPMAVISHVSASEVVIAYAYLALNTAFFATIGLFCSFWISVRPLAIVVAILSAFAVVFAPTVDDSPFTSYLPILLLLVGLCCVKWSPALIVCTMLFAAGIIFAIPDNGGQFSYSPLVVCDAETYSNTDNYKTIRYRESVADDSLVPNVVFEVALIGFCYRLMAKEYELETT